MPSVEQLRAYDWNALLPPAAALVITLIAGGVVRLILLRALKHWARHTRTPLDDLLVAHLKWPLTVWVLLAGVYFFLVTALPPGEYFAIASRVLLILWVVSLTLFAARLTAALIRFYSGKVSGGLAAATLPRTLATLLILTVGGLLLLNLLGVSIAPLLTALGVGGLAVGLALQDTLSNLFAGFYVGVSGHLRPGDYVKLQSGEEGYIADITWRSTTLRTLQNNLVIIPNAKLAQTLVTNFHLPEKRMSLALPVSVACDSDVDRVEEILVGEAKKAAAEVPGLLTEPAPFVRFIPGFGASSLDFTLVCQVAEFTDQYLAQHELRKRIFRRFRAEGVTIPFPVRTVYLRQDSAGERDESAERA